MNDLDPALRAVLRESVPPTHDSYRIAGSLRPRLVKARRRRRRMVAGATTAALLLGLPAAALALTGVGGEAPVRVVADTSGLGDPADRPAVAPSTPQDSDEETSREADKGVASTTTADVSSTSGDHAEDERPASPGTDSDSPPEGSDGQTPPAPASPTSDHPAPPLPASPSPPVSTGPAATVPPKPAGPPATSPTAPPAPSGGTPVDIRTISSSCGSITVRASDEDVRLVSTQPGAGYSVDVKNAGPEKVEVGLEGPSGHCELEVKVEHGALEIDVDEE